ncbi:Arylsulfatase precursor [Planctomycetes bacterium Poly30]|uniref:Arylsulfatase n=1 Tax=Saltatorellus ferox TaxID=2528018 RepID=A0A518EYL0_9BACT|nr:Arylsulfatase precursor [Planctomycetes bacterium Poly30]
MMLTLLLVSLQSATATTGVEFPGTVVRAPRPNVLVLIADDFGVDLMGAYGEGSSPACTANVDQLAAGGLLFRNAWANPTCSPTRASLLTGRHGFRTGVGGPLASTDAGLSLAETTLPEVLVGYSSAALGKWHLSGNQGDLHPNDSGFGSFAGGLRGAIPDYLLWRKTVDGQSAQTTTYATTDTADEAIAAITSLPEPWLTYVSFNAPHTPLHAPPVASCPALPCPGSLCGNLPSNPTSAEYVKAMSEAMDQEIGRILAVLDVVDPDAYVIFVGDNGTARQGTEAPFDPQHAKGTMYEGGVNVPLVIRGPGVRPGECGSLVSVVDLFATIAEIARVRISTEDSVSLVPYFRDPGLSLRETVYSESFEPNGGTLPFASHERAVRDERYKLIRRTGHSDEFFDLEADPFEAANLLPSLTAAQQAAYDQLAARLVALGVS